MAVRVVALLCLATAWTRAVAAVRNSEVDGVLLTVVSPEAGATVDSGPVVVALDVTLENGPGAERVRADPAKWHICYTLNGAENVYSVPVVQPDSATHWTTLKPIDDPRLLVPGSSHIFKAWAEHGACNTHPNHLGHTVDGREASREMSVAGYISHTFHVRRKVSAHAARVAQWERQVAALVDSGRRPAFIEIGTSFFDTLAEKHAADLSAIWVGTSVEPIERYLASLPTREGLNKVNALVCPTGASPSSTSTLYSLDAAKLDKYGMNQFFYGMSSTDPTHLWRSPWFRSRVPLPLYRSMLTSTEVPCVSYADLIDPLSDATSSSNPVGLSGASLGVLPPQSSPSFKRPKKALVGGHRVREKAAKDHADAIGATNILAHLKVDAEGADVTIVMAAVDAAQRTCAWPWRIDFEAAHLHHASSDTTAETEAEGSNSPISNSSIDIARSSSGSNSGNKQDYPSAFTLSGFPASAMAGVLDPRNADGVDHVVDASKYPAFESEEKARLSAARGDVLLADNATSEPLPTVNGRFIKVAGSIGGAPAYAHENGLWWCAFVFELGHWVVHAPSLANGSMLGGVAAHTDAGFQWALPWEATAPWRGRAMTEDKTYNTGWTRFEGTSAVAEFGPPVCKSDEDSRRHRTQHREDFVDVGEENSDDTKKKSNGSGMTSEDLVLELEDLGYVCSCDNLDCTCFTTPRRIALHNPKCAPFLQLHS